MYVHTESIPRASYTGIEFHTSESVFTTIMTSEPHDVYFVISSMYIYSPF